MSKNMVNILISIVLILGVFSKAFADESYVLGAGDNIAISVYGQDDLAIQTLLADSGNINYPFLGEIHVSGLTVKQVEQLIEKGLKGDYLISPNVYVQVTQYRPFYIHGEVKKPGAFPYHPGMTITQAVALAGGFTERADKDNILLIKENNKQKKNVSVQDDIGAGDTITIAQRFF